MLENKKIIYSVLALSLAINFIIIGAAGSAAWRWHNMQSDNNWLEKRLDRSEMRILRHLEGDDRTLAKEIFSKRRPQLLEAVSGIRSARRDFTQSLSADTPDPAALTAALNHSQAAAQLINENLHGAIRDMAQGLSPEARQKIAEHMRHRRSRHRENN